MSVRSGERRIEIDMRARQSEKGIQRDRDTEKQKHREERRGEREISKWCKRSYFTIVTCSNV